MECEHGRLASKCEICQLIEAERRIAELEADKCALMNMRDAEAKYKTEARKQRDEAQADAKELKAKVAELEAANAELHDRIDRIVKIGNMMCRSRADTDEHSEEEAALSDVIRAARTIQEFLWGEYNAVWDLEEWRRMFRKRVSKLDEVDRSNPHASIEIKKRLLQTAALAVAMIGRIEKEGLPPENCEVPSNLNEYSEPLIGDEDK